MPAPVPSTLSPRTCRFIPVLAFLLCTLADAPAPARAADPVATARAADPVATSSPVILERPIIYDERRVRRTIAYRQRHEDPAAATPRIDPKIIVLHHTGGGSLDATWRYFNRARVERGRTIVARAGDLNLSAHYLIDRDGTILRLMPDTFMARHVVGLNHLSIGVENVGDGDGFPLTPAQQAANIGLVRDLKARFPGITHVIGHHEYRAFEGHAYFKERQRGHRTYRDDPGSRFMNAVRSALTDLDLDGPPPH